MARGPYRKETSVYASSCRVYKVSAKFHMYTSRCVFISFIIYILHMVMSAFGVFVNTIRLNECE